MNIRYWLITVILSCKICYSQNFVPNGDFEQFYGCPGNLSQLDSAMFWINPSTGANPVGGTPDYYNQCAAAVSGVSVPNNEFGFQQAHSGVAYSGIYLWMNGGNNYREYIEVPLTTTLITNGCYHFEMYLNLGDICRYTSDNIAVYFSDTLIENINNWLPLPFVPQLNNSGNEPDTMSWILVEGNYVASGGENYLIIGNFNDDSNTDTTLVNNNAPLLGNSVYCYIDDVSLTLCTGIYQFINNFDIKISPNPVANNLKVVISNEKLSEIFLYDIHGRKIFEMKFKNSIVLNIEGLKEGVYLYDIKNSGITKRGKVVKK